MGNNPQSDSAGVVAAAVQAGVAAGIAAASNLPAQVRNAVKDFFIYTANFLPLGKGATDTQPVSIEADSDFIIESVECVVTSTDELTYVDNPPVLLGLSINGRAFMSGPVHAIALSGTAKQSHFRQFPKLVRAGSSIVVQAQLLDTANDRNVRVSLHGFKAFKFPQA